MPSITFLPLDEKISSQYFSELEQNVPYNLLFLSQNSFFFYSVLHKHVSNHANVTVIDFSDELQTIARMSRNEYIDYIGELSTHCNQEIWWLTPISERSPFTSNILLYICYVKIALHYIENQTEELICICESDALRKAIINNISQAKKTSLKIVKVPFIQKLLTKYRKSPNFLNNLMTLYCLFWRILFSRVIQMKLRKKRKHSDKKVLIFSWLDNRNFSGSGTFQDTYFGDLAAELKKNGFEPQYLFYPIFCSYRTFFSKLLHIPFSFYVWEEFISLLDIGIALCKTRSISFPKIKIPEFQNFFISDIITEELENTKKDVSRRLRYLFFMIGKQKIQKILSSSIIYSFENQCWEKMFIMGVHSSFPDIRFVGYTPSTVRKMHTFYSISQYEDNCPRPDVILVNGEKAKEELIQSGFNANTIVAAGAFRYKRSTPKADLEGKKQFFTLLLATSISKSMSIELISKIVEAFMNLPDVHVIIKPHPALSPEYIASLIPYDLEHISIKQDPIEDLLVESDIVLYSDTTVCIEALRLHIPVLHVKSSFSIDMNPLEGIDYVPSVSTPVDIQKTTLQLLEHSPLHSETVDALVESFFKPVDGNTSHILEKYIT